MAGRRRDFRKLAAIDIVFLGYPFVFGEYLCGVVLSAALGAFVLMRGHSKWQMLLGLYLITLGINYLPMLAYTLSMGNREKASAELAEELGERTRAMAKYRRLSLWLLAPLVIPVMASLAAWANRGQD